MPKLAYLIIAIAALTGLGLPAAAQVPQSRPLTVTFSGIVTNPIDDTIMIRQPDGSLTQYRGPVPEYAYRNGDNVSISFATTVPTSAYYSQNPDVPRAADGIYRIRVVAGTSGSGIGFGTTRSFDISGPLGPASDFGIGGLTIVYDSNTDSYALDFGVSGWTAGNLAGPGLRYDASTGQVVNGVLDCTPPGNDRCAQVSGTPTQATVTAPVARADAPANTGFFSFLLGGSWNLPTYNGGPAQVPEPGSMLLFGGGVAWLFRRHARAKRG